MIHHISHCSDSCFSLLDIFTCDQEDGQQGLISVSVKSHEHIPALVSPRAGSHMKLFALDIYMYM